MAKIDDFIARCTRNFPDHDAALAELAAAAPSGTGPGSQSR